MNIHFARAILLPALLICAACAPISHRQFSGATPLEWSTRLANSEMARRGDSLDWKPEGRARWDYAAGLFELSLLKLNAKDPDPRYLPFVKDSMASFISEDGKIQTYNAGEYQLDALNPGKTILALWQSTGDERYKKAATLLRAQLDVNRAHLTAASG